MRSMSHKDPDYVITRLLQKPGRYTGIDSPGHGTQNTTHQAAAQVIARRTLGLKHDRIRFSVPHNVGTQLCSARSKTVSIDGGPLQRWGKVKAIVKKHAALFKQPEKTGPPVPLMVNVKVFCMTPPIQVSTAIW